MDEALRRRPDFREARGAVPLRATTAAIVPTAAEPQLKKNKKNQGDC
jgi:hypothetical protein